MRGIQVDRCSSAARILNGSYNIDIWMKMCTYRHACTRTRTRTRVGKYDIKGTSNTPYRIQRETPREDANSRVTRVTTILLRNRMEKGTAGFRTHFSTSFRSLVNREINWLWYCFFTNFTTASLPHEVSHSVTLTLRVLQRKSCCPYPHLFPG